MPYQNLCQVTGESLYTSQIRTRVIIKVKGHQHTSINRALRTLLYPGPSVLYYGQHYRLYSIAWYHMTWPSRKLHMTMSLIKTCEQHPVEHILLSQQHTLYDTSHILYFWSNILMHKASSYTVKPATHRRHDIIKTINFGRGWGDEINNENGNRRATYHLVPYVPVPGSQTRNSSPWIAAGWWRHRGLLGTASSSTPSPVAEETHNKHHERTKHQAQLQTTQWKFFFFHSCLMDRFNSPSAKFQKLNLEIEWVDLWQLLHT